MVIFPNLMHDLGGTYSIQMIGVNDNVKTSQEESPAEQDIKAPSLIIGNNNDGGGAQSLGQMKIQFKIPFKHAELSKKVMNPYFPFNPNKEDINGKQIIKSPMLKTRETRR